MATPFQTVYDFFLNKVSDYELLRKLVENDPETLSEMLEMYMRSAVVKFDTCEKDLSDRDMVTKNFTEDLTDSEIEVLSTLMVVEWLTPIVNTGDLVKQKLGNKAYKMYSQANHLKEVRELRSEFKKEAETLVVSYSYNVSDFEELR